MMLPDTDQRLFSISRLHGPSLVDALGAAVLTAAWVLLDVAVWRRRQRLMALGAGALLVALVAALMGAVTIAVSVKTDRGHWWLLGAAVLGGIQVAAAWVVTKRP